MRDYFDTLRMEGFLPSICKTFSQFFFIKLQLCCGRFTPWWNLNILKQFIVSKARDMTRPWNFLKYVSSSIWVDLDDAISNFWWPHRFLVCNYTLVTWSSHWRHLLSSFQRGYPCYKLKVHTTSPMAYVHVKRFLEHV